MSGSYDPKVAVPGTDATPGDDQPSFRRIVVPVGSPADSADALAAATRICGTTVNAVLRLVHVRVYDPPMRRYPSRFYLETAAEATALLDEALLIVWGGGAQATTAVIDAPRRELAAGIACHATEWRADMIVLTRCLRPAISRLLLGSVADQIIRKAPCPVLVVHPSRQ